MRTGQVTPCPSRHGPSESRSFGSKTVLSCLTTPATCVRPNEVKGKIGLGLGLRVYTLLGVLARLCSMLPDIIVSLLIFSFSSLP